MEKTDVFLERPTPFAPRLEVAGCYGVFEEKVLLLKRHPLKLQGSRWGLPAGKVEPGEMPLEAAARETLEETGISIDSQKLKELSQFYVRHPGYDFILHVFYIQWEEKPNIQLKIDEHIESAWVPFDEMHQFPLLGGNYDILAHCEKLRKNR